MKTNLLFALLLSTFVSVQACAQNVPTGEGTRAESRRARMASTTPEERADRQTAQLKKQLSLNADQEKTVAAINLKYAQQVQKLMTDGPRDQSALKQGRDLMAAKDDELKAVFSKEQYQQYETVKDSQRDRMRQRRGGLNQR